jgi:hypothetical protein
MSENETMEIISVLNDIKIVMAGKRRYQQFKMLTPSEREVYEESFERLLEDGNKSLEIKSSFKDYVLAQKKLDVAKLRMDVATGNVQTKTDEKENDE